MRLKTTAAVFLLVVPLLGRAGIMADMNQMFLSNSTAPSTLSTKDRAGVFGGSFSMRSPIRSVANIVAFDPPRLNAGCGGIDLYGGSFSFINAQQLVQIFRSVASNAAGLAFKAAIKSISPSLDGLITEFQTLMQNMNNLGKNSCQLSHAIVNAADKSIANAINGDGPVGAVAKNMYSDTMASLTGYLADANAMFKKTGEVNPKAGNQMAKAVTSSGSASVLGLAGLANIDGSVDDSSNPNSLDNRLLISMMGYQITGIPCSNSNASGQPNISQAVSNNNLGTISCTGAATITLDDLARGGGAGSSRPDVPLQLYKCLNPSGIGVPNGGFDPQVCTQMQTTHFAYIGASGWVNLMLFGVSDASSTPTAASIVGKFNGGSTVRLTAVQMQFIKQSGLPLHMLLSRFSNPDARIAVSRLLGQHAVNCVTARLGEALHKAASGVLNSDGYEINSDQKRMIENLRTDYLAKQELCSVATPVLTAVQLMDASTRIPIAAAK